MPVKVKTSFRVNPHVRDRVRDAIKTNKRRTPHVTHTWEGVVEEALEMWLDKERIGGNKCVSAR